MQNKAARTLLSLPTHEPVTDDTFNQLHWLKLEKRIIFKILLLVHKLFINAAPEWFKRQLVIINRNERLLNNFYFQSKSGRRFFSNAAPRFWNCLPREIRLLDNTDTFKARIKTVLFTNENDIINAAHGYTD